VPGQTRYTAVSSAAFHVADSAAPPLTILGKPSQNHVAHGYDDLATRANSEIYRAHIAVRLEQAKVLVDGGGQK